MFLLEALHINIAPECIHQQTQFKFFTISFLVVKEGSGFIKGPFIFQSKRGSARFVKWLETSKNKKDITKKITADNQTTSNQYGPL